MIGLVKKLLEQRLPTMLLVLGAAALAFGFFAITFSPLSVVLRPYVPLVAIAIVLIAVAVGLWLLDRGEKLAAERYLDGHYNLIRFLVLFVEAHEHRMPENLSDTLTGDATHSSSSHQASRYAAMYLERLGFLTANGVEYLASENAHALVRDSGFRARNAGAFQK
jgi:hypothetical protein